LIADSFDDILEGVELPAIGGRLDLAQEYLAGGPQVLGLVRPLVDLGVLLEALVDAPYPPDDRGELHAIGSVLRGQRLPDTTVVVPQFFRLQKAQGFREVIKLKLRVRFQLQTNLLGAVCS